MKIVIGNDHGAVDLKHTIVAHLTQQGHSVNDMGIAEGESADYPDIVASTCREYKSGGYDFGIVCCGTGIGASISANKINGIRCALLCNIYCAQMAKEHNNANMIAFGGRVDYRDSVEDMLAAFMQTEAEGERHERRVKKIMALEQH
jgi:ribose 5-phosphate isomerase B